MWKRRMKRRRRAKIFLEVEKLSWRITHFRTRKKKKKTAWNLGSIKCQNLRFTKKFSVTSNGEDYEEDGDDNVY